MAYIAPKSTNLAKIKVVGVGGGGQNAVDSMIEYNKIDGVEFIAMNTDLQVLNNSKAQIRLQLGPERTHGLGSGSDPQVGFESATESLDEIKSLLQGADMVFVAVGMGGGTGTGAAPVVARIAKETGALTVGVATKPFEFEGKRRMSQAEQGVRELKDKLDALIVIPNQKILDVVDESMPLKDAFKIADQVIGQAVEGISDLITSAGLVNVDFADVKSIMSNAGSALMGIGYAMGENRAEKAARGAINSPLLDVDIKGCTGLLINILGDNSLSMHEVNEAATLISASANENANIIFGANIDPDVEGVKITVIATGFDSDFKSIVLPQESPSLKSDDVIEQIDSRFDKIVEDNETKVVFDERIVVSETTEEENYGRFDYEALQKEVEAMEEERNSAFGLPSTYNEIKDDDTEARKAEEPTSPFGLGGFFNKSASEEKIEPKVESDEDRKKREEKELERQKKREEKDALGSSWLGHFIKNRTGK